MQWMNDWMKHLHQPQARHHYVVLWGQSCRNIAASVLTLVGKGCKMTPSSCRAVSPRLGYCLGAEPVSYIDMARPPRGGCRPQGPWRCCCPLGVCHRSVVFSVCREFSWREQNILQFNSSWGMISLRKPGQTSIIKGNTAKPPGEMQLLYVEFILTSILFLVSLQSFSHNKKVCFCNKWSADTVCW